MGARGFSLKPIDWSTLTGGQSMSLLSMDEMAFNLCMIAQRAGDRIMEIRADSTMDDFSVKEDGSPVTLADLTAHRMIADDLARLLPGVPVVSEEGSSGDSPKDIGTCFLVDPLDGTKEFIKGNGMYTVNIAMMSQQTNSRWTPYLGVVHAPELNITWFGGTSVPAARQDSDGIRAISAGSDRETPIIVGSLSHASPRDKMFRETLGDHVFEGVGSSIKICRVAEGSADLSPRFGTTSCWDTAAAHAILNSAGGNLIGPSGKEIDYDVVEDILNPWFLATANDRGLSTWAGLQRD